MEKRKVGRPKNQPVTVQPPCKKRGCTVPAKEGHSYCCKGHSPYGALFDYDSGEFYDPKKKRTNVQGDG